MPTKQEMEEELELLRKRLRQNEDLLMAASVKAEDMMAVQDKHAAMKRESERLRRRGHP